MSKFSKIYNSDKFYWHCYVPFYETFFSNRTFNKIAELGLFKGDSIRWLLDRFPDSIIYGADILERQDSWPVDSRFTSYQVDQDSRTQVKDFFSRDTFDLIIEDGSHQPKHQVTCLLEGLNHLSSNGIYILEDIQTSHPRHPINPASQKVGFFKRPPPKGNALTVLLGLDHYKKINVPLSEELAALISEDSLLTKEDVLFLDKSLKEINLYRRTQLPLKCHHCGRSDYSFSQLKCLCGADIFSDTDSMSFVLVKN